MDFAPSMPRRQTAQPTPTVSGSHRGALPVFLEAAAETQDKVEKCASGWAEGAGGKPRANEGILKERSQLAETEERKMALQQPDRRVTQGDGLETWEKHGKGTGGICLTQAGGKGETQ